MDAFVTWLQATPLSQAIVFQTWIWPLCETIHFIGLGLLLGTVGFFDLRLMGFFRRVSVDAARGLMPFALAGFALNLVTGLVFLVGHPEQYVHNPAWWWKVASLVVAGVNAAVFEMFVARRAIRVPAGADTTTAAKILGAISLFAWMNVVFWGRMLPFIGNAF